MHINRLVTKPGFLKKPGIWHFRLKKPEIKKRFYMISSKILIWLKKSIIKIKKFVTINFFTYRVATLPGILQKPGIWQFRQIKTWKNLELEKFWKKPWILIIFTCSVVKFFLTQKVYHIDNNFLWYQHFFLLKTYLK